MSKPFFIAIPTDRGASDNRKRSGHFGHSDQFTILKAEKNQATIVDTIDNVPHGAGGCLAPISVLKDNLVNAIVVGGMGKRPLAGFNDAGIAVYWAPLETYPTVDDVITAYHANDLQEMVAQQACTGHNCHHD